MDEQTDETPRDRRGLAEHFERIWAQALLAVSTAEDEATRAVQKVAGVAGWGQDEVRRQAKILTERLTQQRKTLEKELDEAVRRSLTRVRLPRREEIHQLHGRLDRIAERLSALERTE
jgi:polyhydroxyalkanoate synthesis regulator phasin